MKKVFMLCLMFTTTISIGFTQSLSDSLLFYYSCDGNLNDDSGNSLDATTNGTLTQDESGNPNSAYHLDGVDQVINIPYSPSYKIGLPISFSMKFMVESFPGNYTTHLFNNDYKEDIFTGVWIGTSSGQKIGIGYGDGGNPHPNNRRSKATDDTITTGVWYNLVAIWRGPTDMDIYLDCQNQSGTYSGSGSSIAYSTENLDGTVGLGDANFGVPGVFFNGKVDEIAFWGRELSTSEITEVCNGNILQIADRSAKEHRFVKSIAPHPLKDYTVIELNNTFNTGTFSLYNINGQHIRSFQVDSKTITLKREALPAGMYFFDITDDGNELTERGKLIVQ